MIPPPDSVTKFVLTLPLHAQITGSVRGQEARDFLFGRIFTCLAVTRSERLVVRMVRCYTPIYIYLVSLGRLSDPLMQGKGKQGRRRA